MIIVVGSRHDVVANDLVGSWPQAALCSAEDLCRAGWVWRRGDDARSHRWIVEGAPVPDSEVSGVFLRRSGVYAEELVTTHPDDRTFLAAEAQAFLTFILAATSARVVNPVVDGAFGEETLQPDRWTAAAEEAGLAVRPLRATSESRRRTRTRTHPLEIVGADVFGDAPARIVDRSRRAAESLGLVWSVFLFDSKYRLLTLTAAQRPSDRAAAAIGRYLEAWPR